MQNFWIRNSSYSRLNGDLEFTRSLLESNSEALIVAYSKKDYFSLVHYAIGAWHWALALQENNAV